MANTELIALLEEWRDRERELADLQRGTREHDALIQTIAKLRGQYKSITARQVAKADQLDAATRRSFERLYRSDHTTASPEDVLRANWAWERDPESN